MEEFKIRIFPLSFARIFGSAYLTKPSSNALGYMVESREDRGGVQVSQRNYSIFKGLNLSTFVPILSTSKYQLELITKLQSKVIKWHLSNRVGIEDGSDKLPGLLLSGR